MRVLEITAYSTALISFFTPENIAIISGLGSLCLSLSGILLNLYKIKKQNEKTNS
jgi:hypothetical protein